MKKALFLIVITSLIFKSTIAQDANLPLDKSGKITFYEVVEAPGMAQTTLYQNAVGFLNDIEVVKQKKKESYLVEEEFMASSTAGFLVYNYKSPDGEVRYHVSIEVKDNKYRYTITDFVFFPYTRNRYGKFEREKWKSKTLEEPVLKGDRKTWDRHKTKTAEKMELLIARLNLAMQTLPAVAEDHSSQEDTNW